MKLVFTSDLHLDSKFKNENSAVRQAESIKVFDDIADYAVTIGAAAVIMGGDLFDSPFPSYETQSAVRAVISSHAPLLFLAVCGNHDPLYKTDFYKDVPDNMTVFGKDISKVTIEDIDIYGVSVKTAMDNIDPWQNFHADGKFITLSHGELDGGDTFPIGSHSLADSGASLNLLGHIHKTYEQILSNGKRALYSGCPMGRGFDECGEHGFYVIDTDSFDYTYVKTDAKIYKEYNIDISEIQSGAELIEKLRSYSISSNEVARAILTGKTSHPLDIDIKAILPHIDGFIDIKDKSEPDIDVLKNISENTLEGEFVRILVSKLEKAKDEERQLILDALKEGVMALRRQK